MSVSETISSTRAHVVDEFAQSTEANKLNYDIEEARLTDLTSYGHPGLRGPAKLFGKSLLGVVGITSTQGSFARATAIHKLMCSILGTGIGTSTGAFEFDASLWSASLECPVKFNKVQDWASYSGLLMKQRKLSLVIAFVASRWSEPNPEAVSTANGIMKAEVVGAARCWFSVCRELIANITALEDESSPLLAMALLPNLAQVKKYAEGALTCASKFAFWMLSQQLEVANTMSVAVGESTPKYGHILDDEKFSQALCRRHILGWPMRGKLETLTPDLAVAINTVKQLHKEWELKPTIEETEMRETFMAVNHLYDDANPALAVMRGVTTIMELKGSEQQSQATFTLGLPVQLPKALIKALAAVVKK